MEYRLEPLGGLLRALGDVLGDFWRPFGWPWKLFESFLGVFWQSFGGLGCKIELEIVFRGFFLPKEPFWKHLGDVFWVFGGHFGLNFEAF